MVMPLVPTGGMIMAGLSVALVMRDGSGLHQDFRGERKLAAVGERLSSLSDEKAQRYGSNCNESNEYARGTKHGNQDSLESLTVLNKRKSRGHPIAEGVRSAERRMRLTEKVATAVHISSSVSMTLRPSGLSHLAGPCRTASSQPSSSTRTVAGRPRVTPSLRKRSKSL